MGASPSFQRGAFFLRGDLGIDIPLEHEQMLNVDGLGHVNIGAGASADRIAATVELQSAFWYGGDHEDDADRFVHTAGMSVRYQHDYLSPYFMLSTPLDEGMRGHAAAATLGLSVRN
jgi:hypothetical protein